MDALCGAIDDQQFFAAQMAAPIQRAPADFTTEFEATRHRIVADRLRSLLAGQLPDDPSAFELVASPTG